MKLLSSVLAGLLLFYAFDFSLGRVTAFVFAFWILESAWTEARERKAR